MNANDIEALSGVITVIQLGLLLLFIVTYWKIFVKAGKPGWAAIIPIYNIYILVKILNRSGWWVVLLLIPGINIVIYILMMNLLAFRFGKKEGFTIGLFFLPIIFAPILAFSDAEYVAHEPDITAPQID